MKDNQNTQPVRLSNLLADARDVFNSKEKANLWLDAPNPALSGDRLRSRTVTENGLQQVYGLVKRLKYSEFSLSVI